MIATVQVIQHTLTPGAWFGAFCFLFLLCLSIETSGRKGRK